MVWIFWNRVQSIFLHWWKVFSIESWHYLDNNLHWKLIMIYPINIYQTWYVLDWWPHHVIAYYNIKHKIFTLLMSNHFQLITFLYPSRPSPPNTNFFNQFKSYYDTYLSILFFLNLSLLIIFPYSDWAISLSNLLLIISMHTDYLHSIPPYIPSYYRFLHSNA